MLKFANSLPTTSGQTGTITALPMVFVQQHAELYTCFAWHQMLNGSWMTNQEQIYPNLAAISQVP